MSETALARMRPERRAALVRAAAQEFATRTFDEASLNRIISACGMSKSSFYHVVDSKDDLFSLVVAELAAAARSHWTPPAPDSFADEFWGRARSVWADVTQSWPDSRELTLLWHIVYANPDNSAVRELAENVEEWVSAVLAVGRETGAVDDECPLELQSVTVFSLLRTFDEWALKLTDDDRAMASSAQVIDPAEAGAHQFRLLTRLLRA
ncbi:TetR/AcrR family transcriptional regulator [Brevibacterium spongiae]|uniref:TetR/AcrR family transcriptional regulator n=1 Tax=Brevibacterium spongiae TaxID=2909672 RepID=A0ABY5STQ4_9MICO|nr:TetR/AcrR family transcriptional regulator [Brevibacterium spongiae]UVI37520.1 TetR/AcrR family transcriptional regulator [Brevibacterium spongiae]